MRGRPRARPLRLAAVTLVLAAASFAAVPRPHLELARSDPADGSTVSSVSEIRLWFAERPMRMGASTVEIRILDTEGKVLATGHPVADKKDPKLYVLPLPRGLEPRAYRITWQAMAADGDPAKGEIKFTVTGG